MKPLISVVIPTHNRRPFLEEAIKSVRAQRDVDVEIIVVDDASTDDTWEWLMSQDNLSIVRQDRNSRQAAARNAGFAMATGNYVMFLDDDDVLLPGALVTLHKALDSQPAAVGAAGARWDWFVDEGRGRRDAHPRLRRVKNAFDEFLFGWSAIPSQSLYRSSAIRAVNGFDETLWLVEDRDLWLRATRNGPVVFVPDLVVKYRVTRDQFRPANIGDLREHVAQKAIESLPDAEKGRAVRIRRSGVAFNAADESLRAGRYIEGMRYTFKGFAASPQIFMSPLIASWACKRLVRACVRSIIPPRYRPS